MNNKFLKMIDKLDDVESYIQEEMEVDRLQALSARLQKMWWITRDKFLMEVEKNGEKESSNSRSN